MTRFYLLNLYKIVYVSTTFIAHGIAQVREYVNLQFNINNGILK